MLRKSRTPSCIDLILRSCPRSSQNSCTIEMELSDFHNMNGTVMKTSYRKIQPKIINYRDFFSNDKFRESLHENVNSVILLDNCD